MFMFEHFLNNSEDDFSTLHEYCGKCHRLFENNEVQCPTEGNMRYNGDAKKDFFIMFSLEMELKTRCRDPIFWERIQHPFQRQKINEAAIEDVYDGAIYPVGLQPGELNAFGSTDGIKIFKTNHNDLWLVMLVILELPPSIRYVLPL